MCKAPVFIQNPEQAVQSVWRIIPTDLDIAVSGMMTVEEVRAAAGDDADIRDLIAELVTDDQGFDIHYGVDEVLATEKAGTNWQREIVMSLRERQGLPGHPEKEMQMIYLDRSELELDTLPRLVSLGHHATDGMDEMPGKTVCELADEADSTLEDLAREKIEKPPKVEHNRRP